MVGSASVPVRSVLIGSHAPVGAIDALPKLPFERMMKNAAYEIQVWVTSWETFRAGLSLPIPLRGVSRISVQVRAVVCGCQLSHQSALASVHLGRSKHNALK